MLTPPRQTIAGSRTVRTSMAAGIPERRQARMLDTALEHHRAGRLGKALSFYRKYLKRRPDDSDALNMAGMAAFDSSDFDTASRWLEAAKAATPEDPQAYYHLGLVQQSQGRLDEAQKNYRSAIEFGPEVASSHYNLGAVLTQLGLFEDALVALDDALALDPEHAKAYASKGYILRMQGDGEAAAALYGRAVSLSPDDPATLADLGLALRDSGRLREAASMFDRALSIDPDYAEAVSHYCDTLLRMESADAAIAVCDEYLGRHAYHASVLAAKSVALREAGRTAEMAALVDLDRFVTPTLHDKAPGFTDMGAFNDALAKHILAHPSLVVAPTSNATQLGKHSGELTVSPKGPIAAFETLIKRGFESYAEMLRASSDPDHPFAATIPRRWSLNVWSIVLEGQGFQLPHIHRAAWMSGVYYARVPDIVHAGSHDGSHAGWIEFGRPGPEYHATVEPETRAFQPSPGLMVLFPSYMFHETIPFESDETRISIAFDIVPDW
jgi:tetratricopeptide (TPR) repeat protein